MSNREFPSARTLADDNFNNPKIILNVCSIITSRDFKSMFHLGLYKCINGLRFASERTEVKKFPSANYIHDFFFLSIYTFTSAFRSFIYKKTWGFPAEWLYRIIIQFLVIFTKYFVNLYHQGSCLDSDEGLCKKDLRDSSIEKILV